DDEFTPLSELTVGMNKCTVRVRISRLWESFNPKNDISFGLDSLLIDDQGETMQVRVHPDDIDQFEDQLVEGNVYALSNFTVENTRESYMICSNELTMYFGGQTVVNEIEDTDLIPLHSFEFINFKDLRSRCDDTSLLADVLGHIVYVGELEEVWKKSRRIEICNARIRNLRGRELSITLYGDIASGFAEDMLEEGREASVVAVFAGMRVESSHSVCSTTCSKYYLDLEIPEVEEFRANFRIQQENPVPKKSPAQKLAESWRTVEQLKSLDPEEYDEDTTFLCRVSLIDIDCSSGWCYLGCDICQKSMYGAPRKYKCGRCGPIKRPIQWYKLKTKVQDATGTMNLMIFCEVAEELVGVSAEELVDEIEDDDEWYTLPDKIEDLLGSTHTFQVFDKHCNGSFSVQSIVDHVSVPAPAATATQCKEEPVPEGSVDAAAAILTPATTQCKEEPVSEGSDSTAIPTPTTTQCKEEPVSDSSDNAAVPTANTTQCKEEPAPDGSDNTALPTPTATKCKEEP
uniref:Replication factor A C-terminal domain-containing protein n=1 Tax=Setaria italica TaxID=4555 RepID=K4AJF5_SETIT